MESKPAIVFLHGFLEDASIWDAYKKALGGQYQVLVLELPGHGSCKESAAGKSVAGFAGYIHQQLQAHQVSSYLLVGHSLGGYVALALADTFQNEVKGLCLFHSSAFPDTSEKKENRDKTIDFIRKNGVGKFVESFVKPLFHESSREKLAEVITSLERTAAQVTEANAVATVQAMRDRPDRTHVLRHASFPVLFLVGKDDTAVPLDKSMEQVALPDYSQAVFLGKTGHMGMYERPSETLQAITDFAELVFKGG
jgi:pimeloyl-ACP methyl ester carboxylesterase